MILRRRFVGRLLLGGAAVCCIAAGFWAAGHGTSSGIPAESACESTCPDDITTWREVGGVNTQSRILHAEETAAGLVWSSDPLRPAGWRECSGRVLESPSGDRCRKMNLLINVLVY